MYTNLSNYFCMNLCQRKKTFIKILKTKFIYQVINIAFWQIWHFDVTGRVGLEISFILTQTKRRFDI